MGGVKESVEGLQKYESRLSMSQRGLINDRINYALRFIKTAE